MKNNINNVTYEKKLTRTVRDMIEQAIINTHSSNRKILVQYFCQDISERYCRCNPSYQLEKMNLDSISKILNSIDAYFDYYFKGNKFPFLYEDSLSNYKNLTENKSELEFKLITDI